MLLMNANLLQIYKHKRTPWMSLGSLIRRFSDAKVRESLFKMSYNVKYKPLYRHKKDISNPIRISIMRVLIPYQLGPFNLVDH